ncbi:hypothetical protein V6N12_005561 [Hibiscus sabdariffa]|uniref:Malectin-like domain-containing protein n=1 Tax=Hibiscus sabdariffa TaxID=183260 RepID=A0ABR2A964_9ROSI
MMFRNKLFLFILFVTCFEDLLLAIDVQRRNLATENPGFLSIDCGVEDDYLDHATGIWFKSDKEFTSTGENHEILPEFQSDDDEYEKQFGKRYNTLRSFPEGRKNCYSLQLEAESAKNSSFRIRASFSYGNYDRKNQPPKFDLYVGVNYWTTVDSNAYGAFFRENRSSARYKDDIYDRIWYPYRLPNSVSVSTSSDIDGSNLYKVPAEVLRTAVRPSNGSSMTGSLSVASDYEYNVYFHFAELEVFEDKLREISITVNGGITQGPFTLEYLKPLSISFQKLLVVGNFTFTIASTNESGLPPILNALEIYQLKQIEHSATNQSDVDAIVSTKHTYNIDRDDWQGDPCLPKDTTWTGLSCRFDTTPRIISLNLSSSKLTGEISPSLALLQEIESIDLSYNELTGSVPEVLARLPKLKLLNLSGNKLKGPIPQSLQDKSDNGSLLLRYGRVRFSLLNSLGSFYTA